MQALTRMHAEENTHPAGQDEVPACNRPHTVEHAHQEEVQAHTRTHTPSHPHEANQEEVQAHTRTHTPSHPPEANQEEVQAQTRTRTVEHTHRANQEEVQVHIRSQTVEHTHRPHQEKVKAPTRTHAPQHPYEGNEEEVQKEKHIFTNVVNTQGALRKECLAPPSSDTVELKIQDVVTVKATCPLCGAWYTNDTELQSHICSHTQNQSNHGSDFPFQTDSLVCMLCRKSFESAECLTKHMHEKHEKRFQCEQCSKQFTRKWSLNRHACRKFVCPECGLRFKTEAKMVEHCLAHNQQKQAEAFERFGLHPQQNPNPINCDQSSAKSMKFAELASHEPTQTASANPLYDVSFRRNETMQEQPMKLFYQCSNCNALFDSRTDLYRHAQEFHTSSCSTVELNKQDGLETRAFKRPPCDVRYNGNGPQCHIRTLAQNESLSKCTLCDQSYTDDNELQLHMVTHTQEHVVGNPFRCTMCDASFCSEEDLIDHVEVHTKGIAFFCSRCNATLPSVGEVARHGEECNALPTSAVGEKARHTECNESLTPAVGEVARHAEECNVSPTAAVEYEIEDIVKVEEFKFTSCDAVVLNDLELQSHVLTHAPEEKQFTCAEPLPLRCSRCNASLPSDEKMERHLKQCNVPPRAAVELETHNGGRVHAFKCPICDIWLLNHAELQSHVLVHAQKENQFKCTLCDKSYVIERELQSHMLTHTQENAKQSYDISQKNVPEVSSSCDVCGKSFRYATYLRQHIRRLHKDSLLLEKKMHSCPVCEESFETAVSLFYHKRAVHPGFKKKPFQCERCSKAFEKKHLLESHQKSHLDERNYTCSQCSMQFNSRTLIAKHIRLGHGASPMNCPHCSATFMRPMELKSHILAYHVNFDSPISSGSKGKGSDHVQEHRDEVPSQCLQSEKEVLKGIEGKSLKCGLCDLTFANDTDLESHVGTHERENFNQGDEVETPNSYLTERRHVCPECCLSFEHKDLVLQPFRRIHKSKTPMKCTECPSLFLRTVDLQHHMLLHKKENPFQCFLCEASFCSEEKLTDHLKEHPMDLPCRCLRCNALFPPHKDLAWHVQECRVLSSGPAEKTSPEHKTSTHAKENCERDNDISEKNEQKISTPCSVCGKSFISAEYLRKHMRRLHDKKQINCHVCGKVFSRESCLKVHLVSHSNEKKHACPNCGKLFGRRFPMLRHLRGVHKERNKINCSECSMVFLCSADLQNHMLIHRAKKPFRCSLCNACLGSEGTLADHMQEHSKGMPSRCSRCNASFPSDEELTRHVQECNVSSAPVEETLPEESVGKSFKCANCNQNFMIESKLQSHLREHTQENTKHNENTSLKNGQEFSATCDVCDKSFSSRVCWQRHMLRAHKNKEFNCKVCDKSFPLKSRLLDHMTLHSEKKQLACPECGKCFEFKRLLVGHFRRLHKEKKFRKCTECGTFFFNSSDLQNHMLSHGVEKPFECALCDASFCLEKNLADHMKTHPNEMLFQCSRCSASFPSDGDLALHAQKCSPVQLKKKTQGDAKKQSHVHLKEEPLVCPKCDKSFQHKYHLERHLLLHSNERPHVCPKCDKSFKDKCYLKRHLRSHSNEKRLVCLKCDKNFKDKYYLERHLSSHSNERPHACPKCDKSFKHKLYLERHLALHLNEKPHGCPECEKRFTSNWSLQSHIRIVHRMHMQNNTLKCSECSANFYLRRDLKRHTFTHAAENIFQCLLCKAYFSSEAKLNDHMQQHPNELPFECSRCEACFPSDGDLTWHAQECSPVAPKKTTQGNSDKHSFECTFCKMSFINCNELQTHMSSDSHQHASERNDLKGEKNDQPQTQKMPACKLKKHIFRCIQRKHELLSCEVCEKSFATRFSLKIHRTLHLNEKPYACPECGQRYRNKIALDSHIRTVHMQNKTLKCTECSASFFISAILRRHMLTHGAENLFQCLLCKAYFCSEFKLTEHMQEHPNELPFECSKCKACFALDGDLTRHVQECYPVVSKKITHVDAERNSFECTLCDLSFINGSELQSHMPMHTPPHTNENNDVGIQNSDQPKAPKMPVSIAYRLKKEIFRCIQINDELFYCEVCGKSFAKRSTLETHQTLHTNEKLHACPECGQRYRNKMLVQSHIRTVHMQNKSLKCSECSASFSNTVPLLRHMLTHRTENLFQCLLCEAYFCSEDKLRDHIQEHPKEMPLQGPRLKASLPSNEELVLQVAECNPSPCTATNFEKQDDSGVREFKCPSCDVWYLSNAELQLHMPTHARKECSFKCTLCEQSYVDKTNLEYHMRTHIPENTVENSVHNPLCSSSLCSDENVLDRIEEHPKEVSLLCSRCNLVLSSHKELALHVEECDSSPSAVLLFRAQDNLKVHPSKFPSCDVQTHADAEKSVQCTVCDTRFKNYAELESHMPAHSNTNRNQVDELKSQQKMRRQTRCPVCRVSLSSALTLKAHMQQLHSGEKPYSCPDCGKRFARESFMKWHHCLHRKKAYKCMKCAASFARSDYLKSHMMYKHAGVKPYKCFRCLKSFATRSILTHHRKLHPSRKKKPYKCPPRSAFCVQKKGVDVHSLVHSENTGFWCSVCSKCFRYEDILKRHMHTHQKENPAGSVINAVSFQCSTCKARFDQPRDLKVHMRTHLQEKGKMEGETQNVKRHTCSSYGKGFSTKKGGSAQYSHVPTNRKQYNRYKCGKGYGSELVPKEHVGTHFREKPYQSSQCERRFSSRKHMHFHMKTHHSNPYVCSVCKKCFSSKINIKNHMLIHIGEKPFRCSVCKNSLRSKKELQLHVVHRHRDVVPLSSALKTPPSREISKSPYREGHAISVLSEEPNKKCSNCETRFDQREDLEVHVRNHSQKETERKTTDGKSHACSVSEKSFSSQKPLAVHVFVHKSKRYVLKKCRKGYGPKYLLKVHARVHLRREPHQCSICERRFSSRKYMLFHMKTHTHNSFFCSACRRSFSSRNGVNIHMLIHQGEKPFRCSACSKSFRTKTEWVLHTHRHHIDEEILNTARTTLPSSRISETPNGKGQSKYPAEEYLQTLRESHTTEKRRLRPDETRCEKDFKCPVEGCESVFSTWERLRIHVVRARHARDDIYKCTECDEVFGKRSQLAQHRRQHATKDKPFECAECGAHFKTKWLVLGHLRGHAGAGRRPFKCAHCPAGYTFKLMLESHLRAHASPEAVTCSVCGACFKNEIGLKIHMHKHKKESKRQVPAAHSDGTAASAGHLRVQPSRCSRVWCPV